MSFLPPRPVMHRVNAVKKYRNGGIVNLANDDEIVVKKTMGTNDAPVKVFSTPSKSNVTVVKKPKPKGKRKAIKKAK